ncbi:hypothetical protein P8452_28524 [Trifolium repens]|nr:hypothetical protein P8452_28524 [Trifolium repens]
MIITLWLNFLFCEAYCWCISFGEIGTALWRLDTTAKDLRTYLHSMEMEPRHDRQSLVLFCCADLRPGLKNFATVLSLFFFYNLHALLGIHINNSRKREQSESIGWLGVGRKDGKISNSFELSMGFYHLFLWLDFSWLHRYLPLPRVNY